MRRHRRIRQRTSHASLTSFVPALLLGALAAGVWLAGRLWLPTLESRSLVTRTVLEFLERITPLFALVLALLAGLAAFASWRQRVRRRRLFEQQASIRSIRALDWQSVERLMGEAFRRQGYRVRENTSAGADGGIDLVLEKENAQTLVQVKHWQSNNIGVPVVRELLGAVTAHGAQHGMVVCTGSFTQSAKTFAAENGIALYDGERLLELLPHVAAADTEPRCPRCDAAMVRRYRDGRKTPANAFWGCSRFPACRGTRSLKDS